MSSNGNVQFGGSGSGFISPFGVPVSFIGMALLGFQQDLRTDQGGGIFQTTSGTAPNRMYVLRWNVSYYPSGGDAQFEIRMYESAPAFDVVFGTLTNATGGTGIQKATSGPYTQYTGGKSSGLGVRFTGVPLSSPTTTSVTSSANPSVSGQGVTWTATVTSSGSPVTTGSVTFSVNGAPQPATGLNGAGQAFYSNAALAVGSHAIVATYNPAGSFGPSSGNVTQGVNKANTNVVVSSTVNPSMFGQQVQFSATVNATAPGAGLRTGTVQFKDGGVNIGSPITLSGGGSASLLTSALSVGAHAITAVYSGDSNFFASTGSLPTQNVNKGSVNTNVSSTGNQTTYGQSVTFTATVTAASPAAGVPAGTIQFQDSVSGNIGGPVPLTGGQASLTTAALSGGPHTITAQYSGDSGFNSGSATIGHTVNKAGTMTSAVASPNPSTFGQTVSFTATVTSAGSPVTSGTVVFKDGMNTLTAPLALSASGQASFVTSGWLVGTRNLSVEYSGSTNYNQSAGNVGFTVNKANSLTTITSSANPSGFGESVTFTATVAAVAPAFGVPTGMVQFQVAGVNVGPFVPLVSGTASLVRSTLQVGAQAVTAVYNGNATFNGSSASLDQTVTLTAPPFLGDFPVREGACICTPLLMNTEVTGTQYWWVKATGGDLTVTAIAHAVGSPAASTVVAKIYDSANNLVETATASYGPNPPNGFEAADAVVIPDAAGVYRVEVSTPGGNPQQGHYRLKFDGASAAGTSSPSSPSFEHAKVAWNFNVAAGEGLSVRVFTADVPLSMPTTPPTPMTFEYRLVMPDGTLLPAANLPAASLTGASVGFNQTISVPDAMPGTWQLLVVDASEHYRLDKTSGDRGIYLTYQSAGQGDLLIRAATPAAGGSTFTGPLTFELLDSHGVVLGSVATTDGVIDTGGLSVGAYTVRLTSVPPGWSVYDSEIEVYVLCDRVTTVEFVIFDNTPPVIEPLDDIVLDGTSTAGAIVAFEAAANDLGRGTVPVTCEPASGSTFPFGVTRVVCTATDLAGNRSTAAFTVTVNQIASATTVVSSLNPSVYGQSVTFTATVQAVSGSAVPTGSVILTDGVTTLATVNLVNGVATYTTSTLTAGTHPVTASYGGDPLFITSSGSLVQDVNRAPLTVAAADANRLYGVENPPFTGTVSGVVNSDSLAVTYVSAAGVTAQVGEHVITPQVDDAGSGVLSNYAVTLNNGTLTVSKRLTTTTVTLAAGSIAEGGSTTVTITVLDASGASATDVTPSGAVVLGATGSITLGASTCTLAGGACSVTVNGVDNAGGSVNATFAGDDTHTGSGDDAALEVTNVAPAITSLTGPTAPLALGSSATVSFDFTDPGTQDTHACTFTWDNGQTTTVNAAGMGNGSCSAATTYTAPGVYSVGVEVKDKDGAIATATYQFVVVYDAGEGFVTGGGWINSPAGAYAADPALTGRANFGFNAKYLPGRNTPDGSTEFNFKVGNLNFHSTVYEWLVVSGAKAQYKGSGRINNAGDYAFTLTATDGQVNGGGGVDKFRIKIVDKATNRVVYDNNPGGSDDIDSANPQAIGGGSIQIHRR